MNKAPVPRALPHTAFIRHSERFRLNVILSSSSNHIIQTPQWRVLETFMVGCCHVGDDGGAKDRQLFVPEGSCEHASYPAGPHQNTSLARTSSFLDLHFTHTQLLSNHTKTPPNQTTPLTTANMSKNWTQETFTLNTVSN